MHVPTANTNPSWGRSPGLTPESSTRPKIAKENYLESKVQSRLTEEQLRKYKEHGVKRLITITKNWPEVTQQKLADLVVGHLHWQEICQALEQSLKQIKYCCCVDSLNTYPAARRSSANSADIRNTITPVAMTSRSANKRRINGLHYTKL